MRAQVAAPGEKELGGNFLRGSGSHGNGENSTTTLLSAEAADINEAHRLAHTSAADAVRHAVRCGELLIEQKGRLNHGEFGKWVEANCTFSIASANNYMKATKNPNALGNSIRHLYQSGQPAARSKKTSDGDDGLDELRNAIPSKHQLRAFRTRRQRIAAIERAVEQLGSLADQQWLLGHYQGCREKVTRLQNALIDAEHNLCEAENLMLWIADGRPDALRAGCEECG